MTPVRQPATAPVRGELADLADEQREFGALVRSLTDADWARDSAADGWTVADQVSHLADTEEVARDTLTGGPRAFAEAVPAYPTAEDFTAAGCRRGDGLSPGDLTAWWDKAGTETRRLLAARAPGDRVAWGFGMTTEVFATARLMEHWAHGLDIRDALGLPVAETPRLRHIAALGHATLRYALGRARVRPPADRSLRLELTAYDGTGHTVGPDDATDVLHGPLLAWCRVATRRTRGSATGELTAEGELAELALLHARAYL
ncbi:maleylpyruvate isomerase family mycothiol-dependent enzyme [Streptomyces himastatinicus]|uniref:maleylpyruvate isomerase family mycothiol-dependent enzyme n=1 Tax=Streptomyces himastatinicus TaxID=998084 RepID=UPI0001B51FC6|nr:maleylpyruvate isomerase family mycothiol-dependent enzyme [Streptomyces himastatinicus]